MRPIPLVTVTGRELAPLVRSCVRTRQRARRHPLCVDVRDRADDVAAVAHSRRLLRRASPQFPAGHWDVPRGETRLRGIRHRIQDIHLLRSLALDPAHARELFTHRFDGRLTQLSLLARLRGVHGRDEPVAVAHPRAGAGRRTDDACRAGLRRRLHARGRRVARWCCSSRAARSCTTRRSCGARRGRLPRSPRFWSCNSDRWCAARCVVGHLHCARTPDVWVGRARPRRRAGLVLAGQLLASVRRRRTTDDRKLTIATFVALLVPLALYVYVNEARFRHALQASHRQADRDGH